MKQRPSATLVTPALADANNGNSKTALRWASLIEDEFDVHLCKQWTPESPPTDLMLALHARRSCESIAQWAQAKHCERDCQSLIVALTGTDLYKDLPDSAEARHSIAVAGHLITLQEMGPERLPEQLRSKCTTIFQSTPKLRSVADRSDGNQKTVIAVGHLRWEKQPETFIEAARLLSHRSDLHFLHLGNALDETHRLMAEQANQQIPGYQWLGGRPSDETLQAIQQADLLIHPSRMEGGAHVVMEAVRCGTPVLASRIDGNVGLLGKDYAGYFDLGNSDQLTALIEEALPARSDKSPVTGRPAPLLAKLKTQIALRDALFEPDMEERQLKSLLHRALGR